METTVKPQTRHFTNSNNHNINNIGNNNDVSFPSKSQDSVLPAMFDYINFNPSNNNNNSSHNINVHNNSTSNNNNSQTNLKQFQERQIPKSTAIRDHFALIIDSNSNSTSATSSPVRTLASNLFSPISPPGLATFANDSHTSSSPEFLNEVNDAAEILLNMRMAMPKSSKGQPRIFNPSLSSSPASALGGNNNSNSNNGNSKSQSSAASSRRHRKPISPIQEKPHKKLGSRTDIPSKPYERRRSLPDQSSSFARQDVSEERRNRQIISPSLRNASLWVASVENLTNFEASTSHMESFQRHLLKTLIQEMGSKIHELELVYKPATKRKPQARWIPKYAFQKCIWIDEIWREWKYGVNGLISLQELEQQWGSEWVLARKEVKHEKFRRMRVIRELRRLMSINGWNEKQMLEWAHREITAKGINARKWGDTLPKQSSLPADYFDVDEDFE